MNLQQRKELFIRLGNYLRSDNGEWKTARQKAYEANNWFTPEFIDLAAHSIATNYLDERQLEELIQRYSIPDINQYPKRIGIVMAGNIPMVGFHDLLSVLITGHDANIKTSSKDDVLIPHIAGKLKEWQPQLNDHIIISSMIKNCDAYIATGGNNAARYFEYYFKKYPSIIRKNRTSVAILDGNESPAQLSKLADDVYLFFGLGCRNVTKIYVPENYDFVSLLKAFRKYDHLAEHHKYHNNYDYNLAILILNNRYYMTNGSILLVEDKSAASPISQLHYEYYSSIEEVRNSLQQNETIQCTVGHRDLPFGSAQNPGICDYADGVDTVKFLMELSLK